jgi:hypothetical protein
LKRFHKQSIARVVMSRAKIAVLDDVKIFQATLATGSTWRELVLPNGGNNRPYSLAYSGERLFATYTDSRLVAEWQGGLAEIGRMETTGAGTATFASDYLVVGSDGRRIFYVDGARMRSFYLPIALRYVRIVARAAEPRIVALGDGAIIVLDLDPLPRLLDTERYQSNLFVDEHNLVSMNGISYTFSWYDLRTRTATTVKATGPLELRSFDRESKRLVFSEMIAGGFRATIYKVGETQPADVITAPFDQVQIIGDGLVYTSGNKVFGGYHGPGRPELFTTDGEARVVRLSTRYAVSRHELVRGDPRTGAIERVALPEGPKVAYAGSSRGEVFRQQQDPALAGDDRRARDARSRHRLPRRDTARRARAPHEPQRGLRCQRRQAAATRVDARRRPREP